VQSHGTEKFILKTVESGEEDLAIRQRQIAELEGVKGLYLPVDRVEKRYDDDDDDAVGEGGAWIYPRLNMTLDALVEMKPALRMTERIKIMRAIAQGLHGLHGRGRLHRRMSPVFLFFFSFSVEITRFKKATWLTKSDDLGLSPHHVHMNVTLDAAGDVVVSEIHLGGFDPAFLLDHDPDPPGPNGWEDWMSPETQVQTDRHTPASDIFSLGLLVSPHSSSLLSSKRSFPLVPPLQMRKGAALKRDTKEEPEILTVS
jgi:serine/threonine protein kinase